MLFVEIEVFVGTLEEGRRAFAVELNQDQTRFAIADEHACRFVRWNGELDPDASPRNAVRNRKGQLPLYINSPSQ
jgi:hypothetical protein